MSCCKKVKLLESSIFSLTPSADSFKVHGVKFFTSPTLNQSAEGMTLNMPASNNFTFLQQLIYHFFQLNTLRPTMPLVPFQHPDIFLSNNIHPCQINAISRREGWNSIVSFSPSLYPAFPSPLLIGEQGFNARLQKTGETSDIPILNILLVIFSHDNSFQNPTNI